MPAGLGSPEAAGGEAGVTPVTVKANKVLGRNVARVAASVGLVYLLSACGQEPEIKIPDFAASAKAGDILSPVEGGLLVKENVQLLRQVLNRDFQQQFPLRTEASTVSAQSGIVDGDFPPDTVVTNFPTGKDEKPAGFDSNSEAQSFGVSVFTDSKGNKTIIVVPPHQYMAGNLKSISITAGTFGFFNENVLPAMQVFFRVDEQPDIKGHFPVKLNLERPYAEYLRRVIDIPKDAELHSTYSLEEDLLNEYRHALGLLPEPPKLPSASELEGDSVLFKLPDGRAVEVKRSQSGVIVVGITPDDKDQPIIPSADQGAVLNENPVFREKDWPRYADKMAEAIRRVVKAPIPPIQSNSTKDTPANNRESIIQSWETDPDEISFGNLNLQATFGLPYATEVKIPEESKKSPIKSIAAGGVGLGVGNVVIEAKPHSSEDLIGQIPLGSIRSAVFGISLNPDSLPRVTEGIVEGKQYGQLKEMVKALKEQVLNLSDAVDWIPDGTTSGFFAGKLNDGTIVNIAMSGSPQDSFPDIMVSMQTPKSGLYDNKDKELRSDVQESIRRFDERNAARLKQGQPLSPATRDIDDLRAKYGVPFPEYRNKPQEQNMKPQVPQTPETIQPLKPTGTARALASRSLAGLKRFFLPPKKG